MFVNELVKNKLCLQQQTQERQIDQSQESNKNEQVDFTFDSYIPKENNQILQDRQAVENITQNSQYNDHGQQQYEQDIQGSSELQILKSHILTIESIAMKEIQGLKKQLQQQKQEKQQFKKQLQTLKNIHQNDSNESENNKMLDLIKEQNKMLKEALKKQLQINKNLIKDSIKTKNFKNTEAIVDQKKDSEQQSKNLGDKQNNPLQINLTQNSQYDSKQRSKMFIIDRPSIPLPTQNKKSLRV